MRLITVLAAASAAAIFAMPTFAQPRWVGEVTNFNQNFTVQQAPTPQPRFVVEAMSFRAHDETGADWSGSDEVYAVFQDNLNSGQRRFTRTTDGVDSGENRTIAPSQSCIAPLEYAGWDSSLLPPATWRCRRPGSANGLDFTITLYEQDGWSPMACAGNPNQQAVSRNCDDDRITTWSHRFTAAALRTMMPRVGDTRIITEPRQSGYSFTYRLRRLPDAVEPPVIVR